MTSSCCLLLVPNEQRDWYLTSDEHQLHSDDVPFHKQHLLHYQNHLQDNIHTQSTSPNLHTPQIPCSHVAEVFEVRDTSRDCNIKDIITIKTSHRMHSSPESLRISLFLRISGSEGNSPIESSLKFTISFPVDNPSSTNPGYHLHRCDYMLLLCYAQTHTRAIIL